jgi:hypothetical protein
MIELIDCDQLKQRHADRVAEMQRDMQESLWHSQQPSKVLPLRLWIGERLIRLGGWVKAQGAGSPDGMADSAAAGEAPVIANG